MRNSFWLALALMIGAGGLTLIAILIGRAAYEKRNVVSTEPPPLFIVAETLPTATVTSSPTPSVTPTTRPTQTQTPTPSPSLTAPPSPAPTEVADSGCPHPEGWVSYTVEAGDTLFAFQLGSNGAATVDDLVAANCLDGRFIFEGQLLWLPPGAAENAPSSDIAPTALPAAVGAPPPPAGLTRNPNCPCEVVISQGLRLEQIAELVNSLPLGFRGADVLALRIASLPGRESFAGAPPGASLEGYLLPGTYVVTNEMDALAFASMVLDAFDAATGPKVWADASARGLTPYGAVTLASIINRESRSPDQQPLVSSVFHNRLNSDRGLAATVTTQYALGRPGDWWPSAQGYVSTYDSPYNTNLYKGLPPSPIASPSLDALRAAVYPAETNYIYFTGNCRGPGNVYAETYEQHLANARCE